MNTPTPEFQLQFLTNVQRLLSEGLFTATYKYALLLSIADLCLERGDDTDARLTLSTDEIARKFVQYYWRQCAPFNSSLLRQNTGKQPEIISLILPQLESEQGSLVACQRNAAAWNQLVKNVERTIKDQPLWKLQRVGQSTFDFLYPNVGNGNSIELRSGVAFCFRKFHTLITDLVRGAWVRYVRKFNPDVFGTTADLHEFMFGSERASLQKVGGVLLEIFGDVCFYCERPLRKTERHVDHFIPWSRSPIDLGHNFVLAHDSCNSAKSDLLAADTHLERWAAEYGQRANDLHAALADERLPADWQTSINVTRWAYRQTFFAQGLTWVRGKEYVQLSPDWESRFAERRQ